MASSRVNSSFSVLGEKYVLEYYGYDAFGNLISDADRGISLIKYNTLNLPDTIQFVNGNQIVNLYDAAGSKYKSIIYTNLATAANPCYDIAHYTSNTDSIEYKITEYNDNIETYYTSRDTTRRIFNATGYYADNTYYHYIKDHLGNICAVVNASGDSVIQSTMYYASGVPMAESTGRDKQPYLYNGKEFVEAHGWNTYDYGFRGYYATIGRFTSIDPLAESTPWQSPYSYAGNRYINAIDWKGLQKVDKVEDLLEKMRRSLFENSATTHRYTEIDNNGIVTKHIDDDNDHRVMLVKGDKKKEIGTELADETYLVGRRAYFRRNGGGVRMIYNYNEGIWTSPYDTWDEKVAKWLRAKNIHKIENKWLEYEQPIIQETAVWLNPLLSLYNSAKILVNGTTLYGQKADDVDKTFAIISVLTLGAGKSAPLEAVDGFRLLEFSDNTASAIYSIKNDYENLSQKNH